MNALIYFLDGFTKENIKEITHDFLQYAKKECSQNDIYNLLREYKCKQYANENEGIYITTFSVENVLNYKKVIITFQRGIYKRNRNINSTIVNIFK